MWRKQPMFFVCNFIQQEKQNLLPTDCVRVEDLTFVTFHLTVRNSFERKRSMVAGVVSK